ncbi:MAG: hypothetical protein K1X79_13825 [Oligoflexia bacterium]|nr:hypothetical protein [Oligoflexia bacterium]
MQVSRIGNGSFSSARTYIIGALTTGMLLGGQALAQSHGSNVSCGAGFVDTVVPAVGDACAGMCGPQCFFVGFAISTINSLPLVDDLGDDLEEEARDEALNECNAGLVAAYAAKALECAETCGSSNPPCAGELEPADYSPCEANCSQSSVFCPAPPDVIPDFLPLGNSGHNRADCDAGGAWVLRCNCVPYIMQSFKNG